MPGGAYGIGRHTFLCILPHLSKGPGKAGVEQLPSDAAVAALEIGVLQRLAWLNEHQLHLIPPARAVQLLGDALRAVVHLVHLRQAPELLEVLQHPNQAQRRDRQVSLRSQHLLIIVINII